MAGKRQPPMTYERLERAAYHYLARFASSRQRLREVLERKIRRGNDGFAPPDATQQGWIDSVLTKLDSLALIDDTAYARAKADELLRRGKSSRHVRGWLRARGVDEEAIETALAAAAEEAGGARAAEADAALRLAKRRRLGPYRREPADAQSREKELAAFARAGFALSLAKAIVDAEDEAGLEALRGESQPPIDAMEEDP